MNTEFTEVTKSLTKAIKQLDKTIRQKKLVKDERKTSLGDEHDAPGRDSDRCQKVSDWSTVPKQTRLDYFLSISPVSDGSVAHEPLRDMECTVHDLEVMCSNPGRVELGVHSISLLVVSESQINTLEHGSLSVLNIMGCLCDTALWFLFLAESG